MSYEMFRCYLLQDFRHEWQTWNWAVVFQCISVQGRLFNSSIMTAFLSFRGTVPDLKETLIRCINVGICALGIGSKLDELGFTTWMILCTSPSLMAARSVKGCSTNLCARVSLSLMLFSEVSQFYLPKSPENGNTIYPWNQCPAVETNPPWPFCPLLWRLHSPWAVCPLLWRLLSDRHHVVDIGSAGFGLYVSHWRRCFYGPHIFTCVFPNVLIVTAKLSHHMDVNTAPTWSTALAWPPKNCKNKFTQWSSTVLPRKQMMLSPRKHDTTGRHNNEANREIQTDGKAYQRQEGRHTYLWGR